MAKEMTQKEIKDWQKEMEAKNARLTNRSQYKGNDIEELMSEGASGKVFLKYKRQEKERAEEKAELARIDIGLDTQEKVKVFKSLAESYGASLAPRMSWIEIDKVTKATYDKMLVEAGIKEIDVPSYKRYEKLEEKGKGKGSRYFEEKRKKKGLGVPQEFLDEPHNSEEELIEWWWSHNSKDDLLEGIEESLCDFDRLSDKEFMKKCYPKLYASKYG